MISREWPGGYYLIVGQIVYTIVNMKYEWDEQKRQANFEWDSEIDTTDSRNDYGKQR